MKNPDLNQVKIAVHQLEEKILSLRNKKGVWDGHLSSSALSTAVAVFALWKFNPESNKRHIKAGLNWIVNNINPDGGYGDTIKSASNLSTSLLCWSAFGIMKESAEYLPVIQKLEYWLQSKIGTLSPAGISNEILAHYKDDRTFSVPILAMCALAGRLGENGWKYVPKLPYQLAIFPDRFFKWLNLSVVSYAVPALIAMGLVRQKMKPSKNFFIEGINKFINKKVLEVLAKKQPDNGGFLEAIPLTGFVMMSLVGAGLNRHIVSIKSEKFLQHSIREDGSWPIDTNLTTWVTTLSVNAFSNDTFNNIDAKSKQKMLSWLINQQHLKVHPFTKTHPGGWAWIDTKGGVPDGDDTSGALLALKRLAGVNENSVKAATLGLNWLLGIQNSDGGFPTFCKGWGKLPFDASCPDITAHAIQAFIKWKKHIDIKLQDVLNKSIIKAISYLKATQNMDGYWLPLWFGNEEDKNHLNPVYGTSQVLTGLFEAQKYKIDGLEKMIDNGVHFLEKVQNSDGGWGGNIGVSSSIEESSLAIRALVASEKKESLAKGVNYLLTQINDTNELYAKPIGLYFASLWYYEEMYPLVFACGALNELLE